MTKIALLDGGLGQEISKRSTKDTHPLWSIKVMLDTPDVVSDVHRDFIEAGAKVICLNTYAATPTRMERDGYGDRFEDAHRIAIQLAKSAAEDADVQIAGCLPPLVASYVSDVSKNYDDSLAEYRRVVDQQKDSVDLFLIETMSNIAEASAALDAARESGKPVYVGLTLSDDLSDTLRSGERLEDAIAALIPKKPDGIMLNCSIPEAITKAMPKLAGAGVRFGGYANGFTSIDTLMPGGTVDSLDARKDLTPEAYADFALQWVDAGATIIGGCCEVGPAHIKYLADRLSEQGHSITDLG
ncbi:MAG: homocysteine S-methyltransferase family protein [Rhodospirillales bacterium]|nr:homocysteine S-methyltransferase family protein [Rhodospirillales bacterium]MBT4038752.1 homocysteine S-methyltransferase family protein [Rhodospirillales bacterium]MBT4627341.1 homocysteine S-methyltransferase family protein [Rhodospirillales bacterium]MBT5351105.1 homocysteine S-methyltransferase family protein [Rhodospirillales bacterium]MBT5521605.1 homocysteine S-methyltransferase family protein [Rhodospirillales bacterium]